MSIISIGILFNAFVSATVAGSAFALTIFLSRRRNSLSPAMQAYAWFWWFTVLVWTPTAIRYLLISAGYVGSALREMDVILQAAVFFTGPALFYYVSIRVFKNTKLAKITATVSFLLALVSIWFVLQPTGIIIRDVTYFSAEGTINNISLAIFTFLAGIILFLLLYDVSVRFKNWWRTRSQEELYHGLYSMAVVLYLVLGSVDESKAITDWPLIVFRVLYAASFLLVYVIITREEASLETYLVSDDGTEASAYAQHTQEAAMSNEFSHH